MNGIYFSTMCDINSPETSNDIGIRKKIETQYKTFENAGFKMKFLYGGVENPREKLLIRFPFYRTRYPIDRETILRSDFIYIRKPSTINIGMIDFLRCLKSINPDIYIVMELPTFPYLNEIKGLYRLPLKFKDQYATKKLKDYVNRIITYSQDKSIFGIDTLQISNGIDSVKIKGLLNISKDSIMNNSQESGTEINILACANFSYWHGYDRAIAGLVNYYKTNAESLKDNVILHMVGDGSEIESYKKMVRENGIEDKVKFYGKLNGKPLADIYNICQIGLDSMGRHRSGITYNSSLKGKEYCAYGLFVVSGVKTELDYTPDFSYYFRVPADDTPLQFDDILNSFHQKTDGKSLNDVKREISEYGLLNFDLSKCFSEVINDIKKHI